MATHRLNIPNICLAIAMTSALAANARGQGVDSARLALGSSQQRVSTAARQAEDARYSLEQAVIAQRMAENQAREAQRALDSMRSLLDDPTLAAEANRAEAIEMVRRELPRFKYSPAYIWTRGNLIAAGRQLDGSIAARAAARLQRGIAAGYVNVVQSYDQTQYEMVAAQAEADRASREAMNASRQYHRALEEQSRAERTRDAAEMQYRLAVVESRRQDQDRSRLESDNRRIETDINAQRQEVRDQRLEEWDRRRADQVAAENRQRQQDAEQRLRDSQVQNQEDVRRLRTEREERQAEAERARTEARQREEQRQQDQAKQRETEAQNRARSAETNDRASRYSR